MPLWFTTANRQYLPTTITVRSTTNVTIHDAFTYSVQDESALHQPCSKMCKPHCTCKANRVKQITNLGDINGVISISNGNGMNLQIFLDFLPCSNRCNKKQYYYQSLCSYRINSQDQESTTDYIQDTDTTSHHLHILYRDTLNIYCKGRIYPDKHFTSWLSKIFFGV